MHKAPWALTLLALTCTSFGCHALRNVDDKPAGSGPNAMLNDVAVGQSRCPSASGESKPFVVEWDATDLSTFEAKASRDLVFVRYEGCAIEMLYSCSDNGVPGRYGAYESPFFTSGTVESFAMNNQDEVFAKLPLGAASFGSKVEFGQTLELQYFVSGAVNSTRNYVERAALADNPRCASATHYVSAYNLGAFRLLAHEKQAGEIPVDVSKAAGGAKTGSESSNLKQGGDLDSCLTHGQQRCRVPIRLVLQPIDETTQNLDASGAGAPRANPEPAEDTVSERAAKLRDAAADKRDAYDGPGCLEDLDRADAIDKSDETKADALGLRGQCTMLTGDCKAGTALYREAINMVDADKQASKTQLDAAVGRAESRVLPDFEQLGEDARGMATWTRTREARKQNQPLVCKNLAETALKLIQKQRKAGKEPDTWAMQTLGEASDCLWARGDCEGAKAWYLENGVQYRREGTSEADARKQAEDIWTKRHDETGCNN